MLVEYKLMNRDKAVRSAIYELVCDGCKKGFPGSDSKLVFLDLKRLMGYAEESGWVVSGRKHFCPACYRFD